MANHYTEGSAFLALKEDQVKKAKDIILRVKNKIELSEHELCMCEADVESANGRHGVWFHHDESLSPEHAEEIARAIVEELKIDEPFTFSWAHTCSKPRLDEFGGGAFIVKRGYKTYWCDAQSHVEKFLKSGGLIPTHSQQEY